MIFLDYITPWEQNQIRKKYLQTNKNGEQELRKNQIQKEPTDHENQEWEGKTHTDYYFHRFLFYQNFYWNSKIGKTNS